MPYLIAERETNFSQQSHRLLFKPWQKVEILKADFQGKQGLSIWETDDTIYQAPFSLIKY